MSEMGDNRSGSQFLLDVQARAMREDGVEVAALMGQPGRIGTAFALLMLCLPTLVPLPGPFGVIFGSAMALVAVQMLLAAERLWLPGVILRRKLPKSVVDRLVQFGLPPILRLESVLSSGRLGLLTGKTARIFLGLPILVLSVLIALPIPFGNTLPALAILLIAIALVERDGLVIVLAMGMTCIAGIASYYLISAASGALYAYLPDLTALAL